MALLPAEAPPERDPVHQIRTRRAGSLGRGLAGRSDERLAQIAREGDGRAFEVLYERHSAAILRYCRSLLRSPQEAEDVKQEVFVLAISALRRGAEPDAFRPWLYRVAHNACISHLRIRRPVLVADNGVLVGPSAAAEPVDGHREELRQLLDDIGNLPDVQRGALLLREMDGFSYEQVGEVLGLPLPTVRASIFRARRTLHGLAAARDADCEVIQSELAELADRRGRRGRHITSHLTVCSACRDFRDGLRRRPTVLGGIAPAGPATPAALLALKAKLFGGAAAAVGGGGALATAGGSAGVAKIAAVAASSIALLAGMGVEADRAIEHARRPAATNRPALVPGPRTRPRVASPRIPAASGASRRAGAVADTSAPADRVASRGPGGGSSSSSSSSSSSFRAHARGTDGAATGTAAPPPRADAAPRSAPAAATTSAAPRSTGAAPDAVPAEGTGRTEGHGPAGSSAGGERGQSRDGGQRDGGHPGGSAARERGGSGEGGTRRLDEPGEQRSVSGGGDDEHAPAPADHVTSGSRAGASASPPALDGARPIPRPVPAPQAGDGSARADSAGTPTPASPPPPPTAPDAAPAPNPAPTPDPAPPPAADPPPAGATGTTGTAGTAATTPVDAGVAAIPPSA